MKQYRITTENIGKDSSEDAYLSPDDPINEIKVLQYLGGINSQQRLAEWRAETKETELQGSNISVTGTEKARLQKELNIKPGTPEWFRLWYTLPYLTGVNPIGKKDD